MFLSELNNEFEKQHLWEDRAVYEMYVPRLIGNFLTNPPVMNKKASPSEIDLSYGVRITRKTIDIIMEGTDMKTIVTLPMRCARDTGLENQPIMDISESRSFVSRGLHYEHQVNRSGKEPIYTEDARYNAAEGAPLIYQEDSTIEIMVGTYGIGLNIPLGLRQVSGYGPHILKRFDPVDIGLLLDLTHRQYPSLDHSHYYIRFNDRGIDRHDTHAGQFVTLDFNRDPDNYIPYELPRDLSYQDVTGVKCLMSINNYVNLVKRGCFGVFSVTENYDSGRILRAENKDILKPDVNNRKSRLNGTWIIPPEESISKGISYDTFFQVVKSRGDRGHSIRRSFIQVISELRRANIKPLNLIGISDHGTIFGVEYDCPIMGGRVRLLRSIRNQYPYLAPSEDLTATEIVEDAESIVIDSDIEQLWYEAACRANTSVEPAPDRRVWFLIYVNECGRRGVSVPQEHLEYFNTLE